MIRVIGKILIASVLSVTFLLNAQDVSTQGCQDKLFNVTMNSEISIKEAIDNLAETCGMTILVKDASAKSRLNKKLFYLKLKDASLKTFLDTLLKDNDLSYSLKGNKLVISYLITRTFRVHYIVGKRTGSSTANVQVAGGSSGGSSSGGGGAGSSININTTQEFKFWSKIKNEIRHILNTAGDGSLHFTKSGDAWVGPDGQKWDYNPLEPIVNPEAGMITVTGTAHQIERVSRYISLLTKQLKTQVMIDVRIIDVQIDHSKTYGIDWSSIPSLNINSNFNISGSDSTSTTGTFSSSFGGNLTEILKFLKTQGDVRVVSSPKVMTLNNQPAMISVGKEIYYKLTTTNKVGGSDTATSQGEEIRSVFAGILLDITPEVDNRGMITLKINPSITSVDGLSTTTSTTMPPNMRRRQIASVIKVRDGDHAILGGLITRNKGNTQKGVPVLEDIPIIGNAFKSTQKSDTLDELVLIITPHIVRDNQNSVTLRDLNYKTLR